VPPVGLAQVSPAIGNGICLIAQSPLQSAAMSTKKRDVIFGGDQSLNYYT
jgi:hypothetical protein